MYQRKEHINPIDLLLYTNHFCLIKKIFGFLGPPNRKNLFRKRLRSFSTENKHILRQEIRLKPEPYKVMFADDESNMFKNFLLQNAIFLKHMQILNA